jgi:hypothetical protein
VTETALTSHQQRSQVRALQSECHEQMARFRATGGNDPSSCLELFELAILRRDETAWDALVDIYRPQLEHHIQNRVRVDPDELAALTQEAIFRFWRVYDAAHFARARNIKQVLAYWNNCGISVANDWRRRQRRRPPLAPRPEDDGPGDPGDQGRDRQWGPAADDTAQRAARDAATRRLWEVVEAVCRDELDVYIARRRFIEAAPPRDIYAERAEELGSKEAVFRRIRNLKERLQRIPELAELLAELS